MILQSLCRYYEQLLETHSDEVSKPGWCPRRVAYMLDLSPQGELCGILSSPDGKGWQRSVPEQAKRTSGAAPNFLCDNSSYLLGVDVKGKPDRTARCFAAAKELHLELLSPVDSASAQAVRRFFEYWNPENALETLQNQAPIELVEELMGGGNLEFSVCGARVLDDPAVCSAWNQKWHSADEDAVVMTCLVTGKKAPIARLHPAIKGVYGAQPTGACLVGFNARAFDSYGHDAEQGLNAPVSEEAAFSYVTALNYLLNENYRHMRLLDTTVVYWAERNDETCSRIFSLLMGAPIEDEEEPVNPDDAIDALMQKVRSGEAIEGIDLETPFYVLGLVPNTSRLSVRLFHRDTFGAILNNMTAHYSRIDIAGADLPGERKYPPPYMLLKEVESPHSTKSTVSSLLGGPLLKSILSDTEYPEALYTNVMMRVRAAHDDRQSHAYKVTRGRAAIVRACLLKNRKRSEDEVTVSLNEDRCDAPYVLGRLLSVLEGIQWAAIPGSNVTVKDQYFNLACANPSVVFPLLLEKTKHYLGRVKRSNPRSAFSMEREMTGLLDRIGPCPTSLSLEQQGDFLLGYYHQTRRRFE